MEETFLLFLSLPSSLGLPLCLSLVFINNGEPVCESAIQVQYIDEWDRESSITRAINGISGIEKVPLTVALVSSFLIGKFGGGGDTLIAMTKKKTPQILKTDTTLKLVRFSSLKQSNFGIEEAKVLIFLENPKWVANMSMPAEDDPIEAQQEARPPRSFGAKDEIFCLFQGSLDNLGSLKQQYGLAKNANEVLLVIEAYKTLRDRAPYPANHVVSHLSGDFAFVVFDKSTSALFVAFVSSF
ncbi:hypothetical protein Bca4012_086935 [Brassica carinata]